MKLKPTEATEYLINNRLRPQEEFVVDVTAREFDELYSSVKELRGRMKWIEPFSPDEDLNAFLREIVRADLQMRFIETFPRSNETEWEIYVISRRGLQNTSSSHHANGNRKTHLKQLQTKIAHSKICALENAENLFHIS